MQTISQHFACATQQQLFHLLTNELVGYDEQARDDAGINLEIVFLSQAMSCLNGGWG